MSAIYFITLLHTQCDITYGTVGFSFTSRVSHLPSSGYRRGKGARAIAERATIQS